MSQLLWTDYVLIIIVLISTLMSIRRGLLKELFSLINLGLAVFVAFRYSEAITKFVNSMMGSKSVSEAFAMTASFLVIYIIATKLTNKLIRRVAHGSFKKINRVLGIVFGFLRGVVAVIAIVALGLFSMFFKGDAWLKTPVTLTVKPYSDMLLSYIPDKAEAAVKGQIQEADQSPVVQQTKKLMNAVFGTDLDIKKDTNSKPSTSTTTKTESTQVQSQSDTTEINAAVPPDASTVGRPDISNTPLIKEMKRAPAQSDRQILLERQRQLEELRLQQQQPQTNP